jgi:hypothetical protein
VQLTAKAPPSLFEEGSRPSCRNIVICSEGQTMYKIHEPSNTKFCILLSESFRIYIFTKVQTDYFLNIVLTDFRYKVRKKKRSLCLTNEALRHEGLWGSGCIHPRFLDLSTSRRWVVSFTPRPLYPREIVPDTFGYEAEWAPELVWKTWTKENSWSYWYSNCDPSAVQVSRLPARVYKFLFVYCLFNCHIRIISEWLYRNNA